MFVRGDCLKKKQAFELLVLISRHLKLLSPSDTQLPPAPHPVEKYSFYTMIIWSYVPGSAHLGKHVENRGAQEERPALHLLWSGDRGPGICRFSQPVSRHGKSIHNIKLVVSNLKYVFEFNFFCW